jgi:hypothetical protein
MPGIDGETQATLQLFVRTRLTEGAALGQRASQRDVEMRDWHDR